MNPIPSEATDPLDQPLSFSRGYLAPIELGSFRYCRVTSSLQGDLITAAKCGNRSAPECLREIRNFFKNSCDLTSADFLVTAFANAPQATEAAFFGEPLQT